VIRSLLGFIRARRDPSGVLAGLRELLGALERLHTDGPPAPMSEILGILQRMLRAQHAVYYAPSQDGAFLKYSSGVPEGVTKEPDFQASLGQSISDLRAPQLQTIDGRVVDIAASPPSDGVRATRILLPVALSRGPRGIVSLRTAANAWFTAEDLLLADLARAVIEMSYQTAHQRHTRDGRIRFLRSLAMLDPNQLDEALDGFLLALREFIPSKFASVWVLNRLDEALVLRAFAPARLSGDDLTFSSFDSRVLRLHQSLSYTTVIEKKAHIFANIQSNRLNANPKFAARHDLHWFVSFPIVGHDGQVRGVVNLYPESGDPNSVDRATIDITSLLIGQIATTMELSLLRRSREAVAAFHDVFRSMFDRGDQDDSWNDVARITARQLRCEACSIFMRDSRGLLALKGTTGLEGNPSQSTVTYGPGDGLTGACFARNEPIVYYRELEKEFEATHKSRFREVLIQPGRSSSLVFVPIRNVLGQPVGVIRCNNKSEQLSKGSGRFTADDVELLQTIGAVAFSTYFRTQWLLEKESAHTSYLNRLHHEVIHPLEGVLNHIEWLRSVIQRGSLDEELRRRIDIRSDDVVQAVNVIENIVRSIGYSEEQSVRSFQPLNLRRMLLTSRSWLESEARERRVRITIDGDDDLVVVGDPAILHRVFYNLLINALKYVDTSETSRTIRIATTQVAGQLVTDVADNGIGIVEGDEERIFDEDYRGANAQKVYPQGTGRGLAFCRAILRAHRGTIRVASRSKPTVLRISLPDLTRIRHPDA
jgi:signal transduction histidine kinase